MYSRLLQLYGAMVWRFCGHGSRTSLVAAQKLALQVKGTVVRSPAQLMTLTSHSRSLRNTTLSLQYAIIYNLVSFPHP